MYWTLGRMPTLKEDILAMHCKEHHAVIMRWLCRCYWTPEWRSTYEEDILGNALQTVSRGGHEKMVQMLLDAGADINTQGGSFGNELQMVLKGGYTKLV